MNKKTSLQGSPLGLRSAYVNHYDPTLLFPISRQLNRDKIGIKDALPFTGYDIWNAFEISWLNPKGKPVVAIAEITVPCESKNIFESKSAKLYFNSFNNSHFASVSDVKTLIEKDLSNAVEGRVVVQLFTLDDAPMSIGKFEGVCIDDLDVSCSIYQTDANLLKTMDEQVEEVLFSHLLKSNCLVTNQPDWGSVYIKYCGPKIDHVSLLQYIVSSRNHNEFHEPCVERIFCDILHHCKPQKLTVYARYTRRGGLDINPFRTNCNESLDNVRLVRQ